MGLIEIFILLFLHWIADFVVQTDKQAKGKSKHWEPLLEHTLSYTVVFALAGFFWVVYSNHVLMMTADDQGYSLWVLLFFPITFITHTMIDYVTSRINSRLWAEGKVHKFFVSIGFDQMLHVMQIIGTYYLLFKI